MSFYLVGAQTRKFIVFWWCIFFYRNMEEGMKKSWRSGKSHLECHTRSARRGRLACSPRLARRMSKIMIVLHFKWGKREGMGYSVFPTKQELGHVHLEGESPIGRLPFISTPFPSILFHHLRPFCNCKPLMIIRG